jgi:polyphosphate kinase
VSHNIHVRSIIGRFLEHTRVFYFLNGGEEQIYLSSADWMERNLDKRRDLLPGGRQEAAAAGQEGAGRLPDRQHPGWSLQPDGRYVRNTPTGNQNPRSAQATLLERLSNPVLNVR